MTERAVDGCWRPAVQRLYNSTADDAQRLSFYLTYHDAQVYPDILKKSSSDN